MLLENDSAALLHVLLAFIIAFIPLQTFNLRCSSHFQGHIGYYTWAQWTQVTLAYIDFVPVFSFSVCLFYSMTFSGVDLELILLLMKGNHNCCCQIILHPMYSSFLITVLWPLQWKVCSVCYAVDIMQLWSLCNGLDW